MADDNKIEPFKALEVRPRKDESFDRLLRRFTKKVRTDGILKLHTSSKVFEKPSDRRRRKRQVAAWNAQRN